MPRLSHTPNRFRSLLRPVNPMFGRLLVVIACIATVLTCTPAQAQDESGALAFPDLEPEPSLGGAGGTFTRPVEKNPTGAGIDGRIGFIGLKTFGRSDSIAPIELFPYVMSESAIFFGDLRGFISTEGDLGANIGMGFRFIEPTDTALFGANFFYDADGTSGEVFHQLSVGWEARTEMFGAYGNVYFPVGAKNRILEQQILNPRFDENDILFDVRSRTGQAMSGLDLNVQMFLPGDFARDHQIQATAGWYGFNGDGAEDINGVQVQLQGNITPSLTLLTSFTHDKTFGTNVAVGGFFQFGSRSLPDIDLQGQLRRYVQRNYNVIVSQKSQIETGVEAINPLTGSKYVVRHVGAVNGTPDGTEDDPYATIGDAQTAGGDIIFVHAGTTLNENVVIGDGQYIFGEGADVTLTDANYGSFNLPGGDSTGAAPTITGPNNDPIFTIGNNSRLAGFKIENAAGRGIYAKDVENFIVEQVAILNSTDEAIYVENTKAGTISNVSIIGSGSDGIKIVDIDDVLTVHNIYVENAAGNGVHVDGGLGLISFTGQTIVKNAGDAAFRVTNLETLVEVDDRGTTTVADDITTKTPGIVGVEQLVVRNTTGGAGIVVEGNEGAIGFGAVDIETDGASAFYSRDTESVVVQNGYMNSKNAAAIDVEDSGINIALTQLIATNATNGVRLVDTTGLLAVYGTGSLGTGGSISGMTDAIYMENGPSVAMQNVDFTNNGKVAFVDGGESLIIVGSNITQTANMFIDATNLTMLQVYSNEFSSNPLSSGMGIHYRVDKTGTYTASVTNNIATNVAGSFFVTESLAGANGASLAYNFQNNKLNMTTANAVGASVNWTGPIAAYFLGNEINGNQSGQTGIRFVTGSSTDQAVVQMQQNAITLGGSNSIGLDIDVNSTSTIYTTQNGITFNGLNGVGIRAKLMKASGMNVSGNLITDNVGGATGIQFDSVEHLSTLVLNNNKIDLSHASTFVDRGIVLSSIGNLTAVTDPFVTFISTVSNEIVGATTPYSLPATGARGTLLINGVSVQ